MCLLHIMETRNNKARSAEDDDDEWAIGGSLETDYKDHLSRDIASEAVAITTAFSHDNDCIFEMDL